MIVQKKIFISIAHETMILQPTCFKSFQKKKENKMKQSKNKQTKKLFHTSWLNMV